MSIPELSNEEKETINYILKVRKNDINAIDWSGNTPLTNSVYRKYSPNIIKTLLKNPDTNINAKDHSGFTPLMRASQYANLETVKLLVNNGASMYDTGDTGWNSIDLAAESGKTDILEYFINSIENKNSKITHINNSLLLAASGYEEEIHFHEYSDFDFFTNLDTVNYLVKQEKAYIETINTLHQTPLMIAIKGGNYKVLQYLLEHGANIHHIDIDGNTPLDLAHDFLAYDDNHSTKNKMIQMIEQQLKKEELTKPLYIEDQFVQKRLKRKKTQSTPLLEQPPEPSKTKETNFNNTSSIKILEEAKEEKEEDCPVCFEPTTQKTPCHHYLCKNCNETLPTRHCPMCRQHLPKL